MWHVYFQGSTSVKPSLDEAVNNMVALAYHWDRIEEEPPELVVEGEGEWATIFIKGVERSKLRVFYNEPKASFVFEGLEDFVANPEVLEPLRCM